MSQIVEKKNHLNLAHALQPSYALCSECAFLRTTLCFPEDTAFGALVPYEEQWRCDKNRRIRSGNNAYKQSEGKTVNHMSACD